MISNFNSNLFYHQANPNEYSRIRKFLLELSSSYPNIASWWDKRVCPSANQGKHIILVYDSEEGIEGIFIGKPGISAKICTLRLKESSRSQGIGRVLLSKGISRLMVSNPLRFHVTISEAAEEGSKSFFESFGFYQIANQPNRYKKGVSELVYSCPSKNLIQNLLKRDLVS